MAIQSVSQPSIVPRRRLPVLWSNGSAGTSCRENEPSEGEARLPTEVDNCSTLSGEDGVEAIEARKVAGTCFRSSNYAS